MRYSLFLLSFSLVSYLLPIANAQDTIQRLAPVTVKAHLTEQAPLRVSTSFGQIDSTLLGKQQGNTLLPAVNTIPGVRMEERSPGSYRLSLRGSLLRSPFGVRNVKIYYDELPLTDAGGNTYLNLLDPGSIARMNILKGPDGSLYGANSGGVVLIDPDGFQRNTRDSLNIGLQAGSFGLFHQQAAAHFNASPAYSLHLNQSYQRSDGFRQQTARQRFTLQTAQRFQYSPNKQLRLLALYSDLDYRTPGGLTPAQFAEDPLQARPGTATIPGAVEQQAAIYNRTLFGGLIHDVQISNRLRHVAALFGSYTDFRNPFITNYEKRFEDNWGFRTYFDYVDDRNELNVWRINLGAEWQDGRASILNYDNNGGQQGAEQAGDRLSNLQYFYFLRGSIDLGRRLLLESSISLNYNRYGYRGLFPVKETAQEFIRIDPAWMPRFALSYLLTPTLSARASLAKGFSPPTTAEVRSSDNIINTALMPESGWNRELGFRYQHVSGRLTGDVTYFNYRMQEAIVRQLRENGAEFFSNAGGVHQQGIETSFNAWILDPGNKGFIRGLRLGTNLTFNHFRFSDYSDADADYSGNKLTGVPSETIVSNLYLLLPARLDVYLQHNYTSTIPLNDENEVFAPAYHLVQAKVSWTAKLKSQQLTLSAGVDNVLDQLYSLGNDINAFGNRFFNASLPRNYFIGLRVGI